MSKTDVKNGENGIKILTKVVVGSRLHGLDTPTSDYDYRGIHLHPIKDIVSPFKTIKNTTWIEGDEDNTSYELNDFCKSAVHGNATIWEVFFSNQIISTSPVAEEMRENWKKFVDTDKFVMASRGYASNQLNKMELFDDQGLKGQSRTPKFAISYIRVLWQCSEFLKTRQFKCQIDDPELKAFLMDVKTNFRPELVPLLTEKFALLQADVSKYWASAEKMKPDIEWIEDFVYRSYLSEELK